ncbi:hypothetical protein KAF25_008634 [Fusarium avenaceum]|uniref:Aminoglycoside phosphotransferase domain-containing protein n=1 Tax=Fusarium avenaceum TaxID=40199 RepID=A0A9P7HFQ8_9HYPO|nr:hypothetical protein KAF25_008634 [Fusarium avenaceum]
MSNIPLELSPDRFHEVNDNSWIIDHVIITRHQSKPSEPCWPDGEGGFFSIGEAPTPMPPTRPPSHVCPITDIGNPWLDQGTWRVGLAHLRVSRSNYGTREHVTLEALAKRSLSFQIPQVYYHKDIGTSYYIVYSELPGTPLVKAWPKANRTARIQWTQQIAVAYHELSKWRGDRICGVDGGNLDYFWLSADYPQLPSSYHPEVLRANCEEIGLDCSEIVFTHNYMMPLSFTVDEVQGLVGICKWEYAGFLPKDWIRTMTKSNSFTESVGVVKRLWLKPDEDEWCSMIEGALAHSGFKEFWQEAGEWRSKIRRRQNPHLHQPPTA